MDSVKFDTSQKDSDDIENVKMPDRQKTLESIDFLNRTSALGKYAIGYTKTLMEAREKARKEIQARFFKGSPNAFEKYQASCVEQDTRELLNAEAHERAQVFLFRQKEDEAELDNAQNMILDTITADIGATADASMSELIIANKEVSAIIMQVESAKSDLAQATADLEKTNEGDDEYNVRSDIVKGYENALHEANLSLGEALAKQVAATKNQNDRLGIAFTNASKDISEKCKNWFSRRYNEMISYGYGEASAYAIATQEAAKLSKGVISGLIANGNREAANAILDIMDLEKPKKNEETGAYEIDRSKKGYMGAGTIKQFKDAIKAQRIQEAAEAKAQAKAANDALKVEANNIKMMATMDKIKDMETAYALVKALGDKGYVNTSEVLDHCKSVIDSRAKAKEAAAKAVAKAAEDKNKELTGRYEQKVKETISNLIYSTEREVIASSTKGGAVTKATVDKITYTKAYIDQAYTYGLITADERSFFDKSLDVDHANKFMTTVQDALNKAGFRVKHSDKVNGKRNRKTKMKSLSDKALWGESEFYDFDEKRGNILLQVTDKGEFDVAGDTAQSEFSLAWTDPNDKSSKLVFTFGQAQMEDIIDSAWLAYKNNPSTSRKDGKDFITFEDAIQNSINAAIGQKYNNKLASNIMSSLAKELRKDLSLNTQQETRATVINQVRDELEKIQNSIFNPPKEETK